MASGRRPGRPEGPPAPRRDELIAATIELVADDGYRAATLGRIAAAADLSKASVLHYFPTIDALIEASFAWVLDELVGRVGEAVERADAADAPLVYARAMVGHFREHPRHTRMLIEAPTHGVVSATSSERWEPVRDLLAAARAARGLSGTPDLRTAALLIGGAIDAVVAEQSSDPDYDSAVAADEIARIVELAYLR